MAPNRSFATCAGVIAKITIFDAHIIVYKLANGFARGNFDSVILDLRKAR